MPAINSLLPVTSSQAVKKQGTQERSNEPKLAPVKEAEKQADKGLEQDRQALKASESKRFDEALQDEKMSRQRASERDVQAQAEQKVATQEVKSVLAASGNDLPVEGESLPKPVAATAANAAEFIQSELETTAAVAPPLASESVPTRSEIAHAELSQDLHNPATLAAIPSSNSTDTRTSQGESASNQPLSVTSETAASALPASATSAAQDAIESTQTLTQKQPLPNSSASSVTSAPAAPAEPLSSAKQLAGDAQQTVDQAERVRAWRGLNSQELQTAATQSSQSSRQEAFLTLSNGEQTGQLQQFAQSLRLAVKQGENPVVPTGAERSTTATSSGNGVGSEALTSWRTDTAQAHLPNAAARSGSNAATFAQTMQAANFGQALGEKVGQNAWGESIAQRVSLMAGQKMSSAQIQLDPPELGAMTVKVTVNGDQASVSFHSAHAMVRDALEASFPRLQEMLSQQGLQLADAQVSDQSLAQQDGRGASSSALDQKDSHALDEQGSIESSRIVHSAKGLIDFYA